MFAHQKYGRRAVPNRTEKFGMNHVEGGTAAHSIDWKASQKKNTAVMPMAMTKGASVMADPQPAIDPVVIANIKSITATVRINIPMISRLLNLVKPLFRTTFLVCEGISSAEISVVGMITVDTNQNTQLQLTYSTKRAPVIRPKTMPIAPQAPNDAIAIAWCLGSGKIPMSSARADGMVSEAAIPLRALSARNKIPSETKPRPIEITPRKNLPVKKVYLGL